MICLAAEKIKERPVIVNFLNNKQQEKKRRRYVQNFLNYKISSASEKLQGEITLIERSYLRAVFRVTYL